MNLHWRRYFVSSFAFFANAVFTGNSNELIFLHILIIILIGIFFLINTFVFGELREIEKIVYFLIYFLNIFRIYEKK